MTALLLLQLRQPQWRLGCFVLCVWQAAVSAAGNICLCADYLLCCSVNGKWRAALHVRHRLGQRQLTVQVHNALLVACQLGARWQEAAALGELMHTYRVAPDQVTVQASLPELLSAEAGFLLLTHEALCTPALLL